MASLKMYLLDEVLFLQGITDHDNTPKNTLALHSHCTLQGCRKMFCYGGGGGGGGGGGPVTHGCHGKDASHIRKQNITHAVQIMRSAGIDRNKIRL